MSKYKIFKKQKVHRNQLELTLSRLMTRNNDLLISKIKLKF